MLAPPLPTTLSTSYGHHVIDDGLTLPIFTKDIVDTLSNGRFRQFSKEDLLGWTQRLRDDSYAKRLGKWVEDRWDDEKKAFDDPRVLVSNRDLHIAGNLDTLDERVVFLFVAGDLIVDGCLAVYDDPETVVCVTGRLKARDIYTSGRIEVHGDVDLERAFIGDYNDHSTWVGGDLNCEFFSPEDHFVEVGGTLHSTYMYSGRSRPRASKKLFTYTNKKDPDAMIAYLGEEVLRVERYDGEVEGIELEERSVLRDRVVGGKPFRSS